MAKTPLEFYEEWTAEGMAKDESLRRNTSQEIVYLKKYLEKDKRILDLGCGYGRVTIPLAKEGYIIDGLDIAPSFIEKAIRDSKLMGLKIDFRVGDMRNLPYEDNSYGNIISMWGVFVELPTREEQLRAIKEMQRVLISGGFAIIDMPIEKKQMAVKTDEKGDEIFIDPETRLVTGKIAGVEIAPLYNHNVDTLSELMKDAGIEKFRAFNDEMGGKNRQFLIFWKR
ncbi:MAG: class I SAM-dependent methyltransferase [Candidatus Nanoarchaeia archaeon]|nr:class I SAM-dependent methyltransferase [Candidatus Nanoarchaeia archaeon]